MFSDLLRYTISQHMEVNPSEKVIEAGERCVHGNECDKCPYYELGRPDCMLKLINGQRAGIDSLNFDVETYRLRWTKATARLDAAEAEIKRLNNTIDDILDRQPLLVERAEKYAKADAIKEFSERLKKAFYYNDAIKHNIDNLAKEMIGNDNDR